MPENGELRDRMIFEYYNGVEQRFVDPIEIQIKLQKLGMTEEKFLAAQTDAGAAATGKMTVEEAIALEEVIRMLREIFEIPKLGRRENKIIGLSDTEVLLVMMEFLVFTNDLKKTEESNPILQRFTEAESSLISSDMELEKLKEQAMEEEMGWPTMEELGMDVKAVEEARKRRSATEQSASSGSTKSEPSSAAPQQSS